MSTFNVTLPEKILWTGNTTGHQFRQETGPRLYEIADRVRSIKIQLSLADIVALMVGNPCLKKMTLKVCIGEDDPDDVKIVESDIVCDAGQKVVFEGYSFDVTPVGFLTAADGSDLMVTLQSENCFTEPTTLYLTQEKIQKWIDAGGDLSVLMEVLEKED